MGVGLKDWEVGLIQRVTLMLWFGCRSLNIGFFGPVGGWNWLFFCATNCGSVVGT